MKFYTEPSIFILITYQKNYFAITNQDLLMKIEIMWKISLHSRVQALTKKLVLLNHMYWFLLRLILKTLLTEISQQLYSKEPTDYEKLSLLVENLIN